MLIANYHTHTPRCRHASGSEAEYAQAALDAGMQILGFSDHTPYGFPEGYYTFMRMYPWELEDYCQSVRRVQEDYRGRLQIHLGLEVEYYPAFFPQLLPILRDQGIEYMLLGQHWVGNEMDEPYSGRPTTDPTLLSRYCDQVIEAMETGLFTYLAHPDLLNFVGDDKTYALHMSRLCRAAKACQMPLELNLWGLQQGKHYPVDRFWAIAAEEGCQTIIGADAHEAWAVHNPQKEAIARQIVEKYQLELLDTLPLRRI